MSTIHSHDITLYGGSGSHRIVLRPLTDGHLPLLYKWNSDPEVLFWTEGGTDDRNLSYDPETVRQIYGGVSQNAFCFLVEADGLPIGECWLQKMNLPGIRNRYEPDLDVRRIDMCIGEKSWWNKGIGTRLVEMLADFAFYGEHADVLHCICEDYNVRSRRTWEKNGFTLVLTEPLPQPQKGSFEYHYRLTRQDYLAGRRCRPAEDQIFLLPVSGLQPSQLYISRGKLTAVREWFRADSIRQFDPIPVKEYRGLHLMTDGHTRSVAAFLAGWREIPVYLDPDELDMNAYGTCLNWCMQECISSPASLAERIVDYKDYERLWKKRCMELN